ncbi:hypothetical protein Vretimale_5897, partial [Volvox reticuliferus]
FTAGRCALTLASTGAIKAALRLQTSSSRNNSSCSSSSNDVSGTSDSSSGGGGGSIGSSGPQASELPLTAGLLGVAPLPGSPAVLDRLTDKMTACTPALCPYGETVATAAAGSQIINRAPLLGMDSSPVGLVSARVAPWRQARALQALSRLAGPDGSWLLVRDPSVALGPVRSEQLLLTLEGEKNNSSGLGNGAGKDWASAGYDADAMAALLSEARRAMAHRNAVGPLEIPGAEQVMTILRSAVDSVT